MFWLCVKPDEKGDKRYDIYISIITWPVVSVIISLTFERETKLENWTSWTRFVICLRYLVEEPNNHQSYLSFSNGIFYLLWSFRTWAITALYSILSLVALSSICPFAKIPVPLCDLLPSPDSLALDSLWESQLLQVSLPHYASKKCQLSGWFWVCVIRFHFSKTSVLHIPMEFSAAFFLFFF